MIKKILAFFMGVLTLVLMIGAIAGAGMIYDTARRITIETYFFQPDNLSIRRVGVPATVADLGADKMRRLLVEKYITEYFYVIPDSANVKARMRQNSPLALMSTPDVFRHWLERDAPEIQNLAEQGAFRTVHLVGDIEKPVDSDFWTVVYEMKTWYRPNDMKEQPEIRRGTLYLGLGDQYLMEFRENVDVAHALESGRDPATLFRFGVTAIGVQQD